MNREEEIVMLKRYFRKVVDVEMQSTIDYWQQVKAELEKK